jgi:hypothetical protein
MATYNLFLNASQADTAITKAHRLFDQNGLTGQNLLLYGGNIENFGSISTRTLRATGNGLNSSYIENLTGGIRVQGVSQIPSITNGISITGGTYLDYVYGGLRVNGATIVTGNFTNIGSTIHSGPVTINGTTRVTGLLNVTGATTVVGNLNVNGLVDISGSSVEIASNDIRLRGPTIIESNTIIQGNLDVRGDYFLDGIPFSGGSTTYIFQSGSIFTGVTGSEVGGITQGRYREYDLVPNIELGTGSLSFGGGSVGASGAARGEYAIDTQILRRYSNQVASANFSIILGGQENRNNGTYGSIIGGLLNTGNGAGSVILGGYRNKTEASASYSVCLGSNTVSHNSHELVQGNGFGLAQRSQFIGISYFDNTAPPSPIYFSRVVSDSSYITIPALTSAGLFLKAHIVDINNNVNTFIEGIGFANYNECKITTTRTGHGLLFSGSKISNDPYNNTVFQLSIIGGGFTGSASVALDMVINQAVVAFTGITPTTAGPTTSTTAGP